VSQSSNPNLIAVVGATATRKTSVGIELALELDGEVVNADSRLFYRGMDVATAKPTRRETKGVPHHLIDFLDPNEQYGLANYLHQARSTINDIIDRGKLPIVVGGSGQYLWAVVEGWEVPKIKPDVKLRSELELTVERQGVWPLAVRLKDIAPEIAEITDLQNPRRVVRAIERALSNSGNPESNRVKAVKPPFEHFIVGLAVDRAILHARVLNRLESMQNNGWIAEVEALLKAGYSTRDRALSGIGYRQMIGHLNGEYALDEAVRLTAVATNRLIRQQNNWFKPDDTRINWFDMTIDPEHITLSIVESAKRWLASES